jgi:hypothetical protein
MRTTHHGQNSRALSFHLWSHRGDGRNRRGRRALRRGFRCPNQARLEIMLGI